ncbi:efflux RND transporter periplasmic adaptor subunit [Paraflavisolibacter sp. H34]|uniref:efflux RND transporter periplasmic adaptor subunit n=1 Tax=Huijunlia imazamoxiresistens TaxID=3127457 RepID=UPI00301A960B
MQKIIYGLLFVGILGASCGNARKDSQGELNDKKAALEKLKGEQKELNDKITKLEGDISKLDTTAKVENAKLVTIAILEPNAFSHFIELQGKVEAQNISYVAPPNGQGGVVKALYVKQGDVVRKGQVLARLDDQLIRQQIDPLKVQLAAAEDTYKRTKSLWDQGIGTYQQVLTAQTQVETLQKNIALIQRQASLMTVTAPNSGIADQVNVRVGELFTGATQLGPQIRIVNTGDLKVVTQVPENYLDRISKGSTVEIVLPEENNRTINATVSVLSPVIDPSSRTFYIEAKIPAAAGLKANQLAKVKIKDYGNNNAVTIPVNTLQNDEKGKFVMVAAKEGDKLVAHKRTITVGELYGNALEVKSGLQSGDQLITEGFQGLYEGQKITTVVK